MNEEIIYTDNYALIVSDEEIIIGDYVYCSREGFEPLSKQTVNPLGSNNDPVMFKVIAHRPLTDAPILEGVPLLPEFTQEQDVEELSKDRYPYLGPERVKSEQNRHTDILRWGFKAGYDKAKETHKYTEEDLMVVWNVAFNEGMSLDDEINEPVLFKDVIKSLQQPKRPKYFETVCDCQECGANKTDLSLDMGCENKIATIINSKGQTELVGEYIYE